MTLSFRSRQTLRRLGVAALAFAALAVVALLCWLLWLNRYVVYTKDGVKLDFSVSPQLPTGELAVTPPLDPSLPVLFDGEELPELPDPGALTQLSGYYVDLDTLNKDPDAVRAQVEKLPVGTPVLIDIKSFWGVAAYSSNVITRSSSKTTEKVDSLIAWMKDRYYLIARMPAFRDYWYARANVRHGLPLKGGSGSLWADSDGCYWLNPGSDGAVSYLMQTALELRELGFREIVFADFRFPNTSKIVFSGDKQATLDQVASDLVRSCSSDTFAVSFQCSNTALKLPEGRTRLYLTGITADNAAAAAEAVNAADKAAQVVFFTDTGDTRYAQFGVLRPLSDAY